MGRVTSTEPVRQSRLSPTRQAAAAYVGLAATDAVLAGHRRGIVRALRAATKPLLMPTLMLAFARATQLDPPASPTRGHRNTRTATLAAQGMSWGGDVALLSRSEPAFLAGVGSFFGAHVAYTAIFVGHGRALSDPTGRRTTLATLGAAGSLVPVVTWAAGRSDPELRGPVGAYAAMLTAMVTTSTRLGDQVPSRARRTIRAGTALFVASDSLLATRKFLLPHPTPRSDAVVMATYTAGQGLIALGLAQAARAPRPTAAPPTRVEEAGG